MDKTEALKKIIDNSRRIVFFGGAGVSTASGIPDFRSENGLYSSEFKGLSPETILSASFFALHTDVFYDFYRRYMLYPDARPNIVHRWLYELERQNKLRGIVTQNIDGLHRAAGNKRVYELHGSVDENEISGADTLIVAGTSLNVEPAASFIDLFEGRNLIVINKEPTPADEKATLLIRGDIGSIIRRLQGE